MLSRFTFVHAVSLVNHWSAMFAEGRTAGPNLPVKQSEPALQKAVLDVAPQRHAQPGGGPLGLR
jgi:hypothetical protein